jgi:hypothetical protein
MSSLRPSEKSRFEKLFKMNGGYVLGFSDGTFGSFMSDAADIDIHGREYGEQSKAKKLRAFWDKESDSLVAKVLLELIEHWQIHYNPIDDAEAALATECRGIAERLLGTSPGIQPLKKHAHNLDWDYLKQQIYRMDEAVEKDPALAIGTAKELIETCCKSILAERGKPVAGTPDMPQLTKETLRELKLVPEGVSDETRGADIIRRLLQNLGTIGNNLAELRGLYGTGHGKDGRTKGLAPRHAKLAVGAAATLAVFLFETHMEVKSQ